MGQVGMFQIGGLGEMDGMVGYTLAMYSDSGVTWKIVVIVRGIRHPMFFAKDSGWGFIFELHRQTLENYENQPLKSNMALENPHVQ